MNAGTAVQGKVALITGASRGIGLAIAGSLAGLGAKVALCARDPKRLETAAAALKQAGASVVAIPADVRRADEIALLLRATEQSLGPIEILVNNAGIGYFAPVQEASEADWDSVLDTNLKAVFLLSSAVAPGMIERRVGHIINIGSLSGKSAFAGGAIYCASKWGLLGLTQCMAEDLRSYGVRVSAGFARLGRDRFLAPYRQRHQQDAATRRRRPRGRKHRHPDAAKLYQRSAYPARPETLSVPAALGASVSSNPWPLPAHQTFHRQEKNS